MNNSNNTSSKNNRERRRDSRHVIPGTEIKVRKHTFSGLGRFEKSVAVDFSDNGLSFISTHINLELLEKVDFILTLQGRSVEGTAIICHKSSSDSGPRYGLLFLATNSEVTSLVDPEVFANLEISMHAEKTAEYVAQMLGHSDHAVSSTKHWNLLVHAVELFIGRISDIVREKAETREQYQHVLTAIKEFITVDDEHRSIAFKYINIAGGVSSTNIKVQITTVEAEIEYRIGDLKSTRSVQEVIDVIGRAFVDQYRAGFPEAGAAPR